MSVPVSKTSRCLLIFISLVLFTDRATCEDFVQFNGAITVASFKGGLEPAVNAYTNHFSGTLGLKEWEFETKAFKNAIAKLYFDGTNIYSTKTFTELPNLTNSPVMEIKYRSVEEMNARKSLLITPGSHPLAHTAINAVWLAYFSADYLRAQGRVVPIPLCEIRHTRSAFGYSDEVKFLEGKSALPESITWKESKSMLVDSTKDKRLFHSDKKLPDFVDGRVGGVYKILRTTNVSGWAIPVEFEIRQITYTPEKRTNWLTVVYGKLHQARLTASPPQGPFGNQEEYEIADLRYRSDSKRVDSVRYIWTNSEMPSTTNAELVANLKKLESSRPSRMGETNDSNWLMIAFIFILFLPLFLQFYWKTKTTTK